MKLITETIEDVQVLTEERNGKKDYKIKGVFMQADIKNRNGRIYPVETLAKEVRRYSKEFIEKKRAFGELGHPAIPTFLDHFFSAIWYIIVDGEIGIFFTRK